MLLGIGIGQMLSGIRVKTVAHMFLFFDRENVLSRVLITFRKVRENFDQRDIDSLLLRVFFFGISRRP